jgi:hypothetical protein
MSRRPRGERLTQSTGILALGAEAAELKTPTLESTFSGFVHAAGVEGVRSDGRD